jgi:hypothetical protein
MPYVIDASDSVQEVLTPSADDALPAPPTTPSRPQTSSLLAYCNGLIALARRAWAHRQRQGVARAGEFELPLDILARKYPYMYIKTMSG